MRELGEDRGRWGKMGEIWVFLLEFWVPKGRDRRDKRFSFGVLDSGNGRNRKDMGFSLGVLNSRKRLRRESFKKFLRSFGFSYPKLS